MAEMSEAVKKYWPWALGAVAGLYVVSKLMGGSSSGSGAAASYQAAAAMNAQNNAASLSQQQLATQIAASQASQANTAQQTALAGQTAYINALGNVAQGVGTSAAQIITAQAALPVAAINA